MWVVGPLSKPMHPSKNLFKNLPSLPMSDPHCQPQKKRRESSRSPAGVWNGWGYGITFFRTLEPEVWQESLFLRNFRDLPATPRPATEPRDGPPRNFHEKYRKNTPRAEILEPQENTPKIPKKYQNAHFWYFFGIFWYFRGILGLNSGSPEFRAGGYFFGIFSWKFRVGPFRGSVAGRGAQLKKITATPKTAVKLRFHCDFCGKSLRLRNCDWQSLAICDCDCVGH